MFESIGDKFDRVFKKLRGQGVITEKNIREAMHEVKLALLEADVNYKVVKDFTKAVTEKAVGTEVLQSVTPGQMIIKIVNDELISVLGGITPPFELKQDKINRILLLGLQGSGKTTFSGKLSLRFKKKGATPMLVACDIYRPAAIHQLQVVGERVGVPVFTMGDKVKAATIVSEALKVAQKESKNLLIVDTAGRLHINEVLMDELLEIKKVLEPDFTFLVADAMTGQDAVNSALAFHQSIGIDGVCLTKMDGDARGGAALSIQSVTGKPIKFIGVGEKFEDLEEFHAERIASRILGMGDIVSLVEKAQEVIDEKNAIEMQEKIRKQTFTFKDFLDQMQRVRKMGPLTDLMKYIPGMRQMAPDINIDEKEFKRIEAIIQSMTAAERENPDLMNNANRRKRIASGSGSNIQQVNSLIKEFEQARKMMKGLFSGGGPLGKMPGMPGGGGGGGFAGGGSGGSHKKKKKKKKR